MNCRLSRIRITNRTLDLDSSQAGKPQTPRQFLTRVVLKTPVPLWMPSCVARGISHVILSQCNEYFELRCHLLRGLSLFEQEVLGVSAPQMMEDEFNFLNNFTSCGRLADNTLIAGQWTNIQMNYFLFVECEEWPLLYHSVELWSFSFGNIFRRNR